ncbi:MAG: hypothetical protein HYR85_05260 [Planctomycetes bacterium]|nr:hypothetical protein [Planctomycetota bacterium]MBI3846160.1 hypothetical protein [Planctomycetota bacterium]
MSDLELREWQETWRKSAGAAPPIPPDLSRRVRRESTRLVLVTAGEGVVTIAGLAAVAFAMSRRHDAPTFVWGAAVLILFALTWTFALANRRGVWRPSGESVHDFLAIARERVVRRLRAARFVGWLLFAEAAFLVPWGVWEWRATPPADAADATLRLVRWVVVAALAVAFLAWLVWYRRRVLREQEEIGDLTRSVDEG